MRAKANVVSRITGSSRVLWSSEYSWERGNEEVVGISRTCPILRSRGAVQLSSLFEYNLITGIGDGPKFQGNSPTLSTFVRSDITRAQPSQRRRTLTFFLGLLTKWSTITVSSLLTGKAWIAGTPKCLALSPACASAASVDRNSRKGETSGEQQMYI